MQTYRRRIKETIIRRHLEAFPCVALLGARQVGKSTLARKILADIEESIYLDLEDPRDYAKLRDPLAFLEANNSHLICIDEVQRYPEIFQVFRTYLDQNNRPGQLLLLGSASRDLIRQSSESLAGRISYIEINPFVASEVDDLNRLWIQGGYPVSYQHESDISFDWRINYIRTFLERDIPALGIRIPAETLRRFWSMLAHMNGAVLNASKLASSMGVSVPTIKNYIDILEGTFVIRQLRPFHTNTKKRLVKSPKLYFYDVGLASFLLGIEKLSHMETHPLRGNIFENLVLMEILKYRYNQGKRNNLNFYRDSNGNEVDIIYSIGQHVLPVEIKAGETVVSDFFKGIRAFDKVSQDLPYGKLVIYGGNHEETRGDIKIAQVTDIYGILDQIT